MMFQGHRDYSLLLFFSRNQLNYSTDKQENKSHTDAASHVGPNERFSSHRADDQNSQSNFASIVEELGDIVSNARFHDPSLTIKTTRVGIFVQVSFS